MEAPLARITTEYGIEIERTYAHPVSRVWDAITTADGISAWMKYETTLERRIGGRILVDFKSEGNLEGIVCEWVPERVFAYTWGLSVVRWVLEPCEDGPGNGRSSDGGPGEGDSREGGPDEGSLCARGSREGGPGARGTSLRFTNSHVTPDILMGFSAGWHAFIDHLGPYLAGTTVADRYDDLVKTYEDRYGHLVGDEASTDGGKET